jgi:hypothetical protein
VVSTVFFCCFACEKRGFGVVGAGERDAFLVKRVHMADRKTWDRLKRYEDHDGRCQTQIGGTQGT